VLDQGPDSPLKIKMLFNVGNAIEKLEVNTGHQISTIFNNINDSFWVMANLFKYQWIGNELHYGATFIVDKILALLRKFGN